MKRRFSWLFLSGICCLTMLRGSAKGAEFCVSTSTDLMDALWTATDNGEDDVIQVQKGIYTAYSVGANDYDFYYSSYEGHNVTLLGGWTAGCTTREVDPSNTILDGNSQGRALVLIQYGGEDIKGTNHYGIIFRPNAKRDRAIKGFLEE
jgi:hypothetical protein